ncbi:MAG TPA: hypothetical protein VFS64_06760 [Solirubrobacterales bacterium]|nr:hypothetical protein [Solirubrobacterales bacterium]
MTEREQRDLAHRLAQDSDVFDFDRALELVQRLPTEAERLLRNREESKKLQEELDRASKRRRQALIEDYF